MRQFHCQNCQGYKKAKTYETKKELKNSQKIKAREERK